MIRLTEEKSVICSDLICQFGEEVSTFIRNQFVVILFEGVQSMFSKFLLETTDDEGLFLVGQSDPESIVHHIPNGAKFRIGNRRHIIYHCVDVWLVESEKMILLYLKACFNYTCIFAVKDVSKFYMDVL